MHEEKRVDGFTDWGPLCLMQVDRGQLASQDISSWRRVEITSLNIVIKNVNYTDEGLYVLKDYANREVSYTRMELVGMFPELV